MNSCSNDELREQLPEWAAGRLTAAQRAAVDGHLSSCVSCREEVELLGAVRRALPAPPPMDVGRIVAALPAPPRRAAAAAPRDAARVIPIASRRRGRRPLFLALATAGAMAAAAAGVIVTTPDGAPVGAPAPAPSAPVSPGAVELAYLDAADLTAAEYDALMDALEGTDEVLAPVVEPPADSALGGV